MRKINKVLGMLFLIFLCGLLFAACGEKTAVEERPVSTETESLPLEKEEETESASEDTTIYVVEGGIYYDMESVAEYIHLYQMLPENYITKQEARNRGWDSDKGNLWKVTDKMVIGGDRFGNREGLLPEELGREYYECDVNYDGGFRTGERLVYSNDGLIFYTDDHYESFTQIY